MIKHTDPTPSNSIPPIHSLNFDVLWKIFWTNTDIFAGPKVSDSDSNEQARPLNVLRRTSQVCRQWREVILQSPILWGRVIELNLLGGDHRAHWRREIVARAAQAPLYIAGTIRGEESESRVFFSELLDKHWSTVCRFAVSVVSNFQFKTETWDPLQRPAPLLEIFKLSFQFSFEWNDFPTFTNTNLPLFAGSAPVLREFGFYHTPKLQFSLQASWLRQLRTLQLSSRSPSFNATELLHALSNIPFLEHLALQQGISGPLNDGQSLIISLAFLRRLLISNTCRTSLFLLKHIIPSSRCSLILYAKSRSRDVSDTEIEDLCKDLLRYTESYLSVEQILADSLQLRLFRGTIKFIALTMSIPRTRIPFADPRFSISFHPESVLSSLTISRLLTTLLDSRRYTHIKTFQFTAHRRISTAVTEALLDILGIFFSSLSSATYLEITVYGLEILLEAQTRGHNPMPSLQTLELQDRRPEVDHSFHGLVLRFLRNQISSGRPLTTFNISDCTEPDKAGEWDYLEDIKGLKVVWGNRGDKEYICGSGTPRNIGVE